MHVFCVDMKDFSSFLKLTIRNCGSSFPSLIKYTDSSSYKVVSSLRSRIALKDRLCKRLVFAYMRVLEFRTSLGYKMSDKSSTSSKSPFSLPTSVRGMTVLDRDAFTVDASVTGLKVPVQSVAVVRQRYKHWLLKVRRLQPIAELSDDDVDRHSHRLFLFSPHHVKTDGAFGEGDRTFLSKNGVDLADVQLYRIKLTYENFSYDDVLDAILPGENAIGGFSIIGHIAHLNLRDNLLEYKHIIGQVILDKLSVVKTVVHKTQAIDNTFRNFEMEVIAGETNFITVAREHGFSYKLDFSKVYWNPRLATEHQRIVQSLTCGDVLYDVFAGVGPFAIPAAKKGCCVYANDLNSESVHWLRQNLIINKVTDKVKVYNMDGGDFIKSVIKSDLQQRWSGSSHPANDTFHVVMNLPSLAVDFLKFFRGLLSASDPPPPVSQLPVIHCYTFSRAKDPATDAAQMTATALGLASFDDLQDRSVRVVRNVAPGKEMLCVTFRLPWHILAADEHGTSADLW